MTEATKGVLAMIGACLIWGLAPIYYKALSEVPALELFAHRGIWALVFFALILAAQGRLRALGGALSGPSRRTLVLSAALVGVNWGLFIWAVLVERATEASLGYFILPLFVVLLGTLLLGDRLRRAQGLAVALAAFAVALLTWGLGQVPWIALVLAATFALYSLIKNRLDMGAILSVTAESAILAPGLLAVLAYYHATGAGGHFGSGVTVSLMLALAGPITALPLILYSYAARRVRLSTVGLLSYLNPTLQFLVAVLVFAEPFGPWHAVAFPLIWLALAIYSVSALRAERASRRVSRAASAEGATL